MLGRGEVLLCSDKELKGRELWKRESREQGEKRGRKGAALK